ncbi:MAG: hypothetical protein ACLGI9_14905 [Thermoanaerobaculia bacterium]
MERAVQVFAVIQFIIIGLSHTLRPRQWVDFFAFLRERGEAGVFAAAFLSLLFGSIVVAFHNVWSGLPIVLTVIGWAQVLKAFLYFVFPAFGLRKLQIPSHERAYQFVYPGIVFLVLAAVLVYHLVVTS